jgi:hypothetical protein
MPRFTIDVIILCANEIVSISEIQPLGIPQQYRKN